MIAPLFAANALIDSIALFVCIALLHFIWQAAIITLLAFGAGLLLRRRSAQAEYLALVAGMMLLPVIFFATLAWQRFAVPSPGTETKRPQVNVAPRSVPMVFAANQSASPNPMPQAKQPVSLNQPSQKTISPTNKLMGSRESQRNWHVLAPWFAAAYLLGVLAMCLRLLVGLGGARRLARDSAPISDPRIVELLATACRRAGRRTVARLASCSKVAVPTLVGILWPTILLPLWTVGSLSPAELESILLHELVHIGRRDHFVNLMQRLIEAAFFFHPVVWFLSRRISTVREHCCDDAVLALGTQCGDYVNSLVRVAESSMAAGQILEHCELATLRATGKLSRLRCRISRLLDDPRPTTMRLKPAAIVAVSLILIGMLAAPLLLSALASAQPAANPPKQPVAALTTVQQLLHLSGIVIDKRTQKPIAGATVTFQPREARKPPPRYAADDAGGLTWEYLDSGSPTRIATDAAGRYEITLSAAQSADPQFLPTIFARDQNHFPSRQDGRMVSEILARRKSGKKLWFERIELEPGVPVTGMVVDPDGRPLANCDGIIFSSRGRNKLFQVAAMRTVKTRDESFYADGVDDIATDTNGHFKVLVVPGADQVVLRIEPKDFAVLEREGAKPRDFGTLRVDRGSRVVGTVTDELGKPVAGVDVFVPPMAENHPTRVGTMRSRTRTDGQGRFSFPPIEAGSHVIGVLDSRFPQQRIEASKTKPVVNVDFRAPSLATLCVHYLDTAGQPSIHLRFRPSIEATNGDVQYRSGLHLRGNTAEAKIPAGLTNVVLNQAFDEDFVSTWRLGDNGPLQEPERPVAVCAKGSECGPTWPIIKLPILQATNDITIVEQKSAQLTIRAIGSDGKPITKLSRIECKYTSNANKTADSARGTTNSDVPLYKTSPGVWRAIRLRPGNEFTITVGATGYQTASRTLKLQEGEKREVTFKLANAKTSSNGPPAKPVAAAKEKAAAAPVKSFPILHLTGQVVDKFSHKPIAGATVSMFPTEASKPIVNKFGDTSQRLKFTGKIVDVRTNADGRYDIPLTAEQSADPRFVPQLSASHPNYLAPSELSSPRPLIRIKPGVQPEPELFELLPAETVTGSVVGPGGQPAKDCWVRIRSWFSTAEEKSIHAAGEEAVGEATVDAKGRFHANAILGFDRATIETGSPEFGTLVQDLRSKHGELGTFHLPHGTEISGVVVDGRGAPVEQAFLQLRPIDPKEGIHDPASPIVAMSDEHGRFSFEPVGDGKYQVRFLRVGPELSWFDLMSCQLAPVVVTVSEKNPPTPLTVRLSSPLTVRIHFVNSAGRPMKGLQPELSVRVKRGETAYDWYLRWYNGAAETYLPRGLARIEIIDLFAEDRLMSWRISDHEPLHTMLESGLKIDLDSIKQDTDITVIATKPATLMLRAFDANDRPIAAARPRIDYADARLKHDAAMYADDVKGDVSMSNYGTGVWRTYDLFPNQDFTVKLEAPGFEPVLQSLKLGEDEFRDIRIKLRPAAK